MNLDHAKQTFIEESRQSVRALEDALLRLETVPDDKEALDAAFRAAHTVKGSSGMFGYDAIVAFTHIMENVLHRVRDGEIVVDANLIALLLSCGDYILHMVNCITPDGLTLDNELQETGKTLSIRLSPFLDSADALKTNGSGVSTTSTGAVAGVWHISLRFGRNMLRDGMDPLSFIRYLSTLGEITHLTTLPDAMPGAADMDPESCYLGFEMDFKSSASAEAIDGAFEFARADSQIRILPPNSPASAFVDLISSLPEDNTRLADIIAAGGCVRRSDLDRVSDTGDRRVAAKTETPFTTPDAQPAEDRRMQDRRKTDNKSNFVHVPADKLDQLINLVGELVIAGASTSLLAQQSRNASLQEATSTLSRLMEEVRDGALQLRMVQIGDTFNRFNRIVHDMNRELGKDIQLVINGADTELDKTVVEKIGDPLTHLVRNAIDHGIEAPDVRTARGKPTSGTVRLNAYHESGSIVIEVQDDGGGLPRDKILRKAIERGLVSPGQNLTDQEIYNLIFEAGFSTSDKVTSLSGRGVGMDVVRRNVQELRGVIDIDSRDKLGTTIRIRLPLTLAIIDGFLMGVGSASYVVPLDMVVECVELGEEERRSGQEQNYTNLRGEVLPLLRLREQFQEVGATSRRENIVVMQFAGQKAGLVVDKLMGEFQTVIKPLGEIFENLKGVSGSTILGNGEVALILDVPMLIQKAVRMDAQAVAAGRLTA